MSSEVSNLYLQTRSTKNTQFEHQVSYLNLASRALSIVVQDMDVEVSFWVEESINFKLVSFQYSTNQSLEDWLLIFKVLGVTCFVDVQLLPFSSAHWLLCLGNRPLLVTGASLPNDHYNFLTVDILLPWMASISVIGVSDQLMILKDKKVLYLKMHLVLFCLRTSGSPSRPPNGVFLVISPSPLPCAFIPTNWRNTSMSCARRLNRTEALCLLSDVCSNTLNQNECDDNILRFISVTNYWLRHGNVEVRGFDTIKPFSLSSDSIVLNVPMKAKLAFEIHLVSLRSFVEFKTDRVNFSIKSSHIGLLPLGVVQGPGASHQKLLAGNNPAASYWCINVDFDYQLFLRTIALGIRVKLLYGVLHLAELDSPLIGFIFLCFIMLSTFVVPSSMAPESAPSVINSYAP
ncbi:hypothetical protein Bca101_039961 [Brassica carinata]